MAVGWAKRYLPNVGIGCTHEFGHTLSCKGRIAEAAGGRQRMVSISKENDLVTLINAFVTNLVLGVANPNLIDL